jgi:hypothetical protein
MKRVREKSFSSNVDSSICDQGDTTFIAGRTRTNFILTFVMDKNQRKKLQDRRVCNIKTDQKIVDVSKKTNSGCGWKEGGKKYEYIGGKLIVVTTGRGVLPSLTALSPDN